MHTLQAILVEISRNTQIVAGVFVEGLPLNLFRNRHVACQAYAVHPTFARKKASCYDLTTDVGASYCDSMDRRRMTVLQLPLLRGFAKRLCSKCLCLLIPNRVYLEWSEWKCVLLLVVPVLVLTSVITYTLFSFYNAYVITLFTYIHYLYVYLFIL